MIDTNKLFYNRINVNSAELIHLNKILANKHTFLSKYYKLIKELPDEIFYAIWSTPESYLWSKITWDLAHSNFAKSKFLDNYAETGKEYTKTLRKIIEQNSLTDFENVILANTVVKKELNL